MHLERFKADDMLLIKPRPPTRYPGSFAAIQAEMGMGITAWQGNSAVGAAGITRWPLVDEGWIYLSDWFTSRPLVFHRLVKQHMPMMARYMRVKTLVARIEPGLPKYFRWPDALGMTFTEIDSNGQLNFVRYF